jgi:acyl-CoA synthetase (NDP forming)
MTLVPAASEDETVAAARGIGLPVVMKLWAAIVHKTDVGGIALGLAGDDACAPRTAA